MTHMPEKYYFSFGPKAINENHISISNSLILESCQLVESKNILILGCGQCSEIPLMKLNHSSHLDLIDIDEEALQKLRDNLASTGGTNLRGVSFFKEDITDSIAFLSEEAEKSLKSSNDVNESLTTLTNLIDNVEMIFWTPNRGYKYTLIICSLIITQFQAILLSKLEKIFLEYFPTHKSNLNFNTDWIKAKFRFARRLEEAFVAHLKTLATKDAVIYFSDTVRVCFLKNISNGLFSTEGSWITTKTNRLADYFDSSFKILKETSWPWYLPKIDNNSDGRLYDVQAVIVKYKE